MNICCGENTDEHNLVKRGEIDKDEIKDYRILYDDNIYLYLEPTKLKFHEIPGLFHVDDIKSSESHELKMKIEEKKDKIKLYSKKIRDLDLKLANLEKVLLMDDKEQQYIKLLGKYNNQ